MSATLLVRALGAALLLAVMLCGVIAIRAARAAAGDFHPVRPSSIEWPTDLPDVIGRRDVAFASKTGDTIRGWYVPGSNGAAIALVPGTTSDRRHFIPEIVALARGGFGVLAFDLPGAGLSDGTVTWGASERAALSAAVVWLRAADGVRHVGVVGFSQGSYTAVQVAADEPAIEALVLEGGVGAYENVTRQEFGQWGLLTAYPAILGRRWAGYNASEPRAIDVMSRYGGPVLFVNGTEDRDVPLSEAEGLFRAARGPKDTLTVDGAAHGAYARVPGDYLARLVEFFERTLIPRA
ncbi:MAG: alpha/beta fold hydrolase [Vicinamibacterales bacterium]